MGVGAGAGGGVYEKDNLEIVTEQVRLDGGLLKRRKNQGCSRPVVPHRWASGRKRIEVHGPFVPTGVHSRDAEAI